jgi:hypothetical protein
MSWDIDMAKLFKDRDNKPQIGGVLGQVISMEPLRISIYEGRTILSSDIIFFCNNLLSNVIRKATINNLTASEVEIIYKEVLSVGDYVCCLPTEDGQKFFIIDKVGGIT